MTIPSRASNCPWVYKELFLPPFSAGALGIINPEEKELCFGGMLHWQEIVVKCVCVCVWEWMDEGGRTEDRGTREDRAVVMDAVQGSGTLGPSLIKGLLFG